jgi:ABC-type transporter Mla subunit MlaD
MSLLEKLTKADETLAAQLDRCTDAVGGIGAATNAARKQLALALDAARARLTGALADVEAMAGELAADLLAAAGEDLLAVPEPGVSEVLTADAPANTSANTPPPEPVAPVNRVANLPTSFRCLTCGVPLTEDANHCQPCYEAEFALAAAKLAEAPPPNGKPKKRRR